MCTWREKRLGDYISINPATLTVAKYNGSIQYIDISSVSVGQLYGYAEYDINDAPSRARRIIQPNDIIFSTVRPNLRAYYYVKECPTNAICSTGFAVLRAKKNANSRFIYYLVTEKSFVDYLSLVAKGSAYPAVDTNDFKKAKVSIPDLPTQQRIADILSAYDDLIENNNKRIALLEKAAQELYKEWFVRFRFPGHETTRFVNGLPEGWEVKRIKDIATVKSGYAFKSEWWQNDGVPVVKIKDIQNNTIDMSDFSYVSEEIANKAKHFFVTAGDLLIAMTGATIGKIALVPKSDKMTVNQRVGKFFLGKEPIKRVPFLFCLFLQNSIQEQIITIANSNAAQPNISPFDIEKLKIFYNTEIIARFNDVLTPSFQKIINLRAQNQNLAKQRDLLLPRLMSGKLEV